MGYGEIGNYSVGVSGPCGMVGSEQTSVIWTGCRQELDAIFLEDIADQTAFIPASVTFHVTIAFGTGPFSYLWRHNGEYIYDGIHYSGTTSPTLIIHNVTFDDAGTYECAVGVVEDGPLPCAIGATNVAHLYVYCHADWNRSGGAPNSSDFFDFLTDFFASDADYNMDSYTNSADFFAFLTDFYTACP